MYFVIIFFFFLGGGGGGDILVHLPHENKFLHIYTHNQLKICYSIDGGGGGGRAQSYKVLGTEGSIFSCLLEINVSEYYNAYQLSYSYSYKHPQNN